LGGASRGGAINVYDTLSSSSAQRERFSLHRPPSRTAGANIVQQSGSSPMITAPATTSSTKSYHYDPAVNTNHVSTTTTASGGGRQTPGTVASPGQTSFSTSAPSTATTSLFGSSPGGTPEAGFGQTQTVAGGRRPRSRAQSKSKTLLEELRESDLFQIDESLSSPSGPGKMGGGAGGRKVLSEQHAMEHQPWGAPPAAATAVRNPFFAPGKELPEVPAGIGGRKKRAGGALGSLQELQTEKEKREQTYSYNRSEDHQVHNVSSPGTSSSPSTSGSKSPQFATASKRTHATISSTIGVAASGVVNYQTDENRVDDVKTSLARSIQSGILTRDYGKLLLADIWFDLPPPGEPHRTFFPDRNRLRVLVDSGSQTSALARSACDRLKLWPIVDRSFARSLGGIAGTVTNGSYGRIHYSRLRLPVNASDPALGGNTFDCSWEVLDLPESQTFEGILGLDFLRGGVLDLNRMQLEVVNPKTMARATVKLLLVAGDEQESSCS